MHIEREIKTETDRKKEGERESHEDNVKERKRQ